MTSPPPYSYFQREREKKVKQIRVLTVVVLVLVLLVTLLTCSVWVLYVHLTVEAGLTYVLHNSISQSLSH